MALLRDHDSGTPVALCLSAAAMITTVTVAVAVVRDTRGRDLARPAGDSMPHDRHPFAAAERA